MQIPCKFHAKIKFYATRGIEVLSKFSNAMTALGLLIFYVLSFLVIAFSFLLCWYIFTVLSCS